MMFGGVGGIDGIGDLAHDLRDFLSDEWGITLRIALEEVAEGPLDGQKVQSLARFTNLDGADDVRVKNPGAVGGFT